MDQASMVDNAETACSWLMSVPTLGVGTTVQMVDAAPALWAGPLRSISRTTTDPAKLVGRRDTVRPLCRWASFGADAAEGIRMAAAFRSPEGGRFDKER